MNHKHGYESDADEPSIDVGSSAAAGDEDPGTLRDVQLATWASRPAITPLQAVWNGDIETVELIGSGGPISGTESKKIEQESTTQTERFDFDSFYLTHWRRLVAKLIKACSGDAQLAQDIAQETFLAAYRHLDRLNELDDPAAWLMTVGKRTAIRYFEREALRTERTAKRAVGESTSVEFDDEVLLNDLLRRALNSEERQVVEFRYLEGRERQWIAERVGISLRTVDNRISSALAKLRRHLAQTKEDKS